MSDPAHPRLARLRHELAGRPPQRAERDPPFFEAAVALVLRPAGDDLEALFIKRADRRGDPWSGQVALPGGRHEPGDPSLRHTALRETLEETGLDLTALGTVLGELDELRPRTPVLPPVIVRPYVVALAPGDHAIVASDEVAGWFWAPLGPLFATAAPTRISMGAVALRVDALQWEGHVIWGMTERILRAVQGLA